jgi:four helix bundle protein
MAKSYRDLFIWQASVQLAADIIELVESFPPQQRYVLIDQMERSAVSVASNIAEGKGRLGDKELRHFLGTARGSLFELHTQLEIATRVRLVTPAVRDQLLLRMAQIGVGLNRFIKKLSASTAKRLNR